MAQQQSADLSGRDTALGPNRRRALDFSALDAALALQQGLLGYSVRSDPHNNHAQPGLFLSDTAQLGRNLGSSGLGGQGGASTEESSRFFNRALMSLNHMPLQGITDTLLPLPLLPTPPLDMPPLVVPNLGQPRNQHHSNSTPQQGSSSAMDTVTGVLPLPQRTSTGSKLSRLSSSAATGEAGTVKSESSLAAAGSLPLGPMIPLSNIKPATSRGSDSGMRGRGPGG